MSLANEIRISAPRVQSLVWDGDFLIDWADGGACYGLDGSSTPASFHWGFPFDAAVSLPGSGYAAAYTRLGTKGVITRNGKLVREINRSYYCAGSYEYPIALFRDSNGRPLLAHCPDEYCRLEIEDLATGERLSVGGSRKPADFFHSRLQVSPDGRRLVSGGWIWHPLDCTQIYDLELALRDPAHLDGPGLASERLFAEESSASFLPDGRLVIATSVDDDSPPNVAGMHLYLLDRDGAILCQPTHVASRSGIVMALDENRVLALYDFPRLLDLATGTELARWPHLRTGTQTSSVCINAVLPPLALDAAGRRIAVADEEGITVLQFAP